MIDTSKFSDEQLLAAIQLIEEQEKKKRGRGRPNGKLLADKVDEDALVQTLNSIALQLFDEGKEKFTIINKVRAREYNLGKALFWALIYRALIECGLFVRGENIVRYHIFLTSHLPEKYICAREKIAEKVSDWNNTVHLIRIDIECMKKRTFRKKLMKYKDSFEFLVNLIEGV